MESLQQTPLEKAKARILAPRDGSSLNLSGLGLTSEDLEVIFDKFLTQELLNLTRLDLSNNLITVIPEKIKYLHRLEHLYLSNNQITKITEEIKYLDNLEELHLSNNLITEIIEEIKYLDNLEELHLSSNQITAIAEGIKHLTKLRHLDLNTNLIKEMPENIWDLLNLEYLDLNNNQITAMPARIGSLAKLEYLDLNNNLIEKIPVEISDLHNLEYLGLNSNQITAIPEYVLNELNKWIKLDIIIGNPLDIETINNLQAIGIINDDTQDQQEYEDTLSQGDNPKTLANPAKEMAKEDNDLVIGNITAEDVVEYFVDSNKPANNITPITNESTQTSTLSLQ